MTDLLKKITFLLLVMMTSSAVAQRLQTVDKDGNPVPYASVVNSDGDIIGTTDLNGVIADVKGAKTVSITHVAFKPKKVNVEQEVCVMLDDADFDLPEITVKQKPLVYVQTYYRIIYLNDEDNEDFCFYRVGLINNSYDRNKKSVSSDEDHFSACDMGAAKTVLNMLIGSYVKDKMEVKIDKFEDRLLREFKESGLTFVPDSTDRQLIKDNYGQVGTIVDNRAKGERRYSYERHEMRKHKIMASGSDKQKNKAQKREENEKDRVDQDFTVYRIDEDGNYAPEDCVMSQIATSYISLRRNSRVNILIQWFTTDRAYVTKDELKQLKKENKMEMTFDNIMAFEREHRIPAISEELQKRIEAVSQK